MLTIKITINSNTPGDKLVNSKSRAGFGLVGFGWVGLIQKTLPAYIIRLGRVKSHLTHPWGPMGRVGFGWWVFL